MSTEYQPGQCNIGPAEQDKRRRFGHLGMGAAVVWIAVVIGLALPTWALLVTAVPLFGGFIGYLQARERFCANFGMSGVYDVAGEQVTVEDEAARQADRRRSLVLTAQSAAYAIAVALAIWLAGRLV